MDALTKWLNVLVKEVMLAVLLFVSLGLNGQSIRSLTLQEVYTLSEENYPLIRQRDLIRQTDSLTLRNLTSGFLPQVSVNGQASYQSDVISLNLPIPGLKGPVLSKDQYKVVADVSQQIYDGGLIREQESVQRLNTSVETKRIDVELHALKDRVNQLYFSILYQDQLLRQNDLLVKDVEVGIAKVQQQVNNGTVLRSNLQVLRVQLLQSRQKAIEISNTRKGLTDVLSLFIHRPVNETDQLQIPTVKISSDTSVSRPEVQLYENQSKLLAGQQKLVDARSQPKASAFVQGGYGRPGINPLSNSFDPFYVTGLRVYWSLGTLYNAKREKHLLDLGRQTVDIQKETFLLNLNTQLSQRRAEIAKFTELLAADRQIIELRRDITETSKVQLENAVITANDYIREINAEDAARQALAIHQLQLLQAQLDYQLIAGKL
jgi:outer membrane protein TolC